MPFADLSTGARLFYEDLGQGEPLIAIHGFLGTARTDLGQVLDWLDDKYRVLGLTIRGYGQSEPKPRDYPLDFYHRDARDVLAFMDALGIEKAHILGYSDGGEISLICAGMQPERFKSVIVWGAVGYFGPAMRPAAQRLYPPTWMGEQEKRNIAPADPNVIMLGWLNAIKHMIDAGGDVSLSLAPNITCPTLLMLGDQDKLNPEKYGRNFVERMPNGRLVMFHCGHPIHQQNWEEFQQVVGNFLEEVRAGKSV
jgi:valacyclovir hydrolase